MLVFLFVRQQNVTEKQTNRYGQEEIQHGSQKGVYFLFIYPFVYSF